MYVYATTNAAAVKAGAIGADDGQILTLASALVVPGATTFYADASDQVNGSSICKFEGITFGFR